jgi:antitoxin PrlF
MQMEPDCKITTSKSYFLKLRKGVAMQVTDKGQITIPKAVRLAAGVTPGSQVSVRFDGGKIVIEKLASASTVDRRAQLKDAAAKARATMSPEFQQLGADQIMAFLRA